MTGKWFSSGSSFTAWKKRPVYVTQCKTARIANMLGLYGVGLRCLPGHRNERSQQDRNALAAAIRHERRVKRTQLKNYVVLYRDGTSMAALDQPLGFQCYAEDSNHAEEQCENAYPDCEIVWVWQGPNGIGMQAALNDWLTSGVPA